MGFVVTHWCWLNFITFSLLMWLFLPFYRRHGFNTMPDFLEKRFSPSCRIIYSIVSVALYILALIAGVCQIIELK